MVRAIAEQTNLLALNVAIEATCVGETDRGSAFVANGIRSLTYLTGESIRKIETVIVNIQLDTG